MSTSPTIHAEEVTTQMNSPFFNLVDEPWIPVLLTDGTDAELSIIQVFERAESIRRLNGELPTMRPTILRILIAVMSRALGLPKDPDDWAGRVADWETVTTKVEGYLAKHRERFWLRHPNEPFFQVADLGPAKGEPKGLGAFVADYPANVQMFTQRGPDSLERMAPAEAARWLIHTQAYDTSGIKTPDRRDPRAKGGKVYPLGTAWGGKGEILIASGENLAFTLRLNYIAPESIEAISGPEDLPPWERPHPGPLAEFDTPARPRGFLQVYTWQARRLRLVFDGESVVRVVLCYGDPLAEQNRRNLDPMMTWRYSKPQSKKLDTTVFMPGMVDPSKAVWRSLAAWLPTKAQARVEEQPQFKEPGVLQWIGKLASAEMLDNNFMPDISTFGVEYGPQSATFAEVADDSLKVPPFLLAEDAVDAASTVLAAIDDADTVAWYLGTYAVNLAKARGIDAADTPRTEAREEAYLVFGKLFKQWLTLLEENTAWSEARTHWQKAVKVAAFNQAKTMADEAGEESYIGRLIDVENKSWLNTELALIYLRRGLAKTLTLAFEEENHDG
ncbi:type I-E CRISPR-associated protein Cse1/CasA [Brevibacterium sp. 50QC2O2]|uniref:type I-E CRISPR-associated protein Cse1/CasA n=1 Tax=Brevibacterium sp. 50QC2O2 TaxID=2968459 RepID=UPI00211CBC6C|nr:type I-E CRISPR-associated protein Cse1/CasA [Brevibacterium sp. 50QC2O2]MCQ9387258.1 type I-E CRISPR-associated protein Cse1/CasA [Brevibacterium sp. 50QC2O2]